MLQQLLNSISGSLTATTYSYPITNASTGGISISPGQAFKNFFKSLFNTFSSSQLNGFQGGVGLPNSAFQQGYGSPTQGGFGYPQGAINAFNDARGITNINKKGGKALAPGSVINYLNDLETQQRTNTQPLNQGFFPQNQFVGQGSPLQGFAGQGAVGGFPGGVFNNNAGPIQQQFAPYNMQQQNSPGGFLPYLLFPIIGLVGAVKTIFHLKTFMNSFKPVEIDPNVSYYQYNNYLQEIESQEGDFDEHYADYEYENPNPPEDFDYYTKLKEF